MKKKGFTLIELLAVIIILAVIALIATPVVLNVVDNAKKSADKASANGIIDSAKLYYSEQYLEGKGTVSEYECTFSEGSGCTELSLTGELPSSGTLKINSKGQIAIAAVYDDVCFIKQFDETNLTESDDTQNCAFEQPTITYASYSIGNEVTLTDGTTWIVIKDTTTSESEIKLMATSNVHPNLTTETGTAMFVTNGYTIAYDDDSNVWANSTLKSYLDNTVKSKLETSLNTTISDITIWGSEELTALGCTLTGNDTDGYSAVSCDNTKSWYSKVFESTRSWTKLPNADHSVFAWFVVDDGRLAYNSVSINSGNGARPIITVSKSVISQ